MVEDPSRYRDDTLSSPAEHAFGITPSDVNDLTYVTRGLYIGTAGNVTCILEGDTDSVTFSSLAVGVVHPLRVRQVLATGTSAGALVGVY